MVNRHIDLFEWPGQRDEQFYCLFVSMYSEMKIAHYLTACEGNLGLHAVLRRILWP